MYNAKSSPPRHEASGKQYQASKAAAHFGRIVLIAAAISNFLFPSPSHAGFSQSSLSMAGQSISGGFVAKAEDSSAIFLNPAGLSQISRSELSLSYSKPFAGLSEVSFQQGYAALAIPAGRRWTLAAAGNSFDADGLLSEQEGALGVVVKVSKRLAVGTNVTYLRHSYNVSGDAAQDPTFAKGRSKGAVGVDAGALLNVSRFLTLGFSGRHLNKPDVGLGSRDIVPRELLGGARVRMGHLSLLADVMVRDAGNDVADGRETSWAAGTEWSILSRLALRAGMNRGSLAAGMGFSAGDFRLDYNFSLSNYLEQDNAGGHHAVLSYRFGSDRFIEKKNETFAAPKQSKPVQAVKSPAAAKPAGNAAGPKKPSQKTSTGTKRATSDKNAPYKFLKRGY